MQGVFSVILVLVAFLGISWRLLDSLFPWLKYDIKYFMLLIKMMRLLKNVKKQIPVYTIIQKLVDQAKLIPEKPFIYFDDDVWTYQRLNEYSNQIAWTINGAGIGINQSVAMLMHSSPSFVGVWFGIAKTGATSAFINYNIRGKSLLHCLRISQCKAIVVENDQDFIKALEDIREDLIIDGIDIYILGITQEETKLKYKSLNELMDQQPKREVPLEWRKDLTLGSNFCFVYTSGTTGLPKAAVIRHDKAWMVTQVFIYGSCRSDDIVYSPLPMYHASSGILGLLGVLNLGASIVIRKKFSASHFWEDCRRHRATVVQYIGETIRYVCDQPVNPEDKNHCVRLILGNGLRPVVWKKFLERYGKGIKVMELYASTEGNAGFINLDNHLGSVGLFSPLIKVIGLMYLIKYDKEKEEIVKDKNGRCVEVPNGTPGILICRITSTTMFHGYHGNKKQTERKILRNVFKDGDSFFNSGDLLRREHDYHLYFVDRVGDNFRWKGENISTNEVSDTMNNAPGLREVNVYGVEISGYEGRAGMMVVLLRDDNSLDCAGVYEHACNCLASYGRPLFLRVKKELELTGTYKQKKVQLMKEGCNPENMAGDAIYYMNHNKKCYSPLSHEEYNDIISGKIRI